MRTIPYFKYWTKTSLIKFSYNMKLLATHKGALVFKEGETASAVYIVKSGEFEVISISIIF